MTLRGLEVFLAVVDADSMRGAAERLYISQPSVSGVVADLENEYGVRLFERLGKKLYITPEGRQLAGYARRMLGLNGEIQRQMVGLGGRAPLRIGATVTVGSSVIAGLVQDLEPQPFVFVGNTGMIEEKLLKNLLDVGLVEGLMESGDVISTPVIRDRMVLVCRQDHPLGSRASIRLEELDGVRLVMREQESGARRALDRAFGEMGIRMELAWECNNSQAILNAVANGFGVSILSPRLLDGWSKLAAIPIENGPMDRWFSLVVHKDKFIRPSLQTFMERCMAYA